MRVERAVPRALERVADAPRQVDIRRRDRRLALGAANGHDPVKRMLRMLGLLDMVNEAQHLVSVLDKEAAAKRYLAGRHCRRAYGGKPGKSDSRAAAESRVPRSSDPSGRSHRILRSGQAPWPSAAYGTGREFPR